VILAQLTVISVLLVILVPLVKLELILMEPMDVPLVLLTVVLVQLPVNVLLLHVTVVT